MPRLLICAMKKGPLVFFLYVVDYTISHLCGDYNEPLIWGWPQGSFGRWLEGKTLP